LEILTIQQKLYESCFNSVAEVARILDVSIKKIYRMAAKGQIPSLKISSSIRFDPHDIAVWLRCQSSTNPIPAVLLPSRAYLRRGNGQQINHAPRIRPTLDGTACLARCFHFHEGGEADANRR
jgi:excisionase family DNA binding protein